MVSILSNVRSFFSCFLGPCRTIHQTNWALSLANVRVTACSRSILTFLQVKDASLSIPVDSYVVFGPIGLDGKFYASTSTSKKGQMQKQKTKVVKKTSNPSFQVQFSLYVGSHRKNTLSFFLFFL